MISLHFHRKPFTIIVIQLCALTSNAEEAEVKQFYEDQQDFLELTHKKDVLFIIGDWNAQVESQETSGVAGKLGLGIQNKAGQRLIEFCQENVLVIKTPSSNNTNTDVNSNKKQPNIKSDIYQVVTILSVQLVQFSRSVVSDSLQPHESQHARPPCPSPYPRVHSNSCPSSWWCHPAISSSVIPFSSCPNPSQHQSLFQWVNSSHEVAKVLELQLQHHSFQRTPRADLL